MEQGQVLRLLTVIETCSGMLAMPKGLGVSWNTLQIRKSHWDSCSDMFEHNPNFDAHREPQANMEIQEVWRILIIMSLLKKNKNLYSPENRVSKGSRKSQYILLVLRRLTMRQMQSARAYGLEEM
jgi:hypothetical protein